MEWLLPSWEIRWIYETHNISATLQTLVCIVCSLQECVLYCTCTCNKDIVYVLLCSVPFSLNWDMVVLSAVTPFREEIFLSPRSRPFIISKQHSYSPPAPQQSSVQKACFLSLRLCFSTVLMARCQTIKASCLDDDACRPCVLCEPHVVQYT